MFPEISGGHVHEGTPGGSVICSGQVTGEWWVLPVRTHCSKLPPGKSRHMKTPPTLTALRGSNSRTQRGHCTWLAWNPRTQSWQDTKGCPGWMLLTWQGAQSRERLRGGMHAYVLAACAATGTHPGQGPQLMCSSPRDPWSLSHPLPGLTCSPPHPDFVLSQVS